MRIAVENKLEQLRAEKVVVYVLMIQKNVRMLLCKIRFRAMRRATIRLQQFFRNRLHRIRFVKLREASVKLQALARRRIARKAYFQKLEEYRRKKAEEEEAARIAAEKELERLRQEAEEAERQRQEEQREKTAQEEAEEREKLAKEQELLKILEKSAEEKEKNAKKLDELAAKKAELAGGKDIPEITEADLLVHALPENLHKELEEIKVYKVTPGKANDYIKLENEFPILERFFLFPFYFLKKKDGFLFNLKRNS